LPFRGDAVTTVPHLRPCCASIARENYLAADAFLMWDKDHQDGQLVVVPGLLKRRQIERAYYLNITS
jgi:hypothetical protein